jgi:integrase
VIALVEKKAETAPIAANRLLELLVRLFNFAIDRELLDANPCARVQKPGGRESSRDRVLSPDEIRELWNALDRQWFTEQTAAALRLILVTAQRPGEVVSIRREDLDLSEGWWTIPAERAKNGLAHRVPLNGRARETLESLPDVSPWVFPSPGRDQHIHRDALAIAIRRARQRHTDPLKIEDFSPHDLRRTAASHMASVGVERFVIGKLLNHVEPGVTKVYDRHSYDAEKKKAMDKWARMLSSILTYEPTNVAEISR